MTVLGLLDVTATEPSWPMILDVERLEGERDLIITVIDISVIRTYTQMIAQTHEVSDDSQAS